MLEDVSNSIALQRPVLATPRPQIGWLGWLAFGWGVGGVVALLLRALWRLGPAAFEGLTAHPLGWFEVVLTCGWVALMAYGEGFRAMQQAFAPRVVARAWHLAASPRPLHVLLAPAYAMGLIHAAPRRLAISWSVLGGIVGLVLVVRQLPQPWRGMIDAGVVVGLTWGVVAILVYATWIVLGGSSSIALELPEGAATLTPDRGAPTTPP